MDILDNAASNTKDFWHYLFAADSIAVIGASDIPGSWGYNVFRQVLKSANAKRTVYPVNPRIPEIFGVDTYASILDIPQPIELAVIVVAAPKVPMILNECVQKRIKVALIVSAGFAEVDEVGAELEAELVTIAKSGSIRFVGPNCIGHADMNSQLMSAAFGDRIRPGRVGLISQSGSMGARIVQIANNIGIGFSKFISTGNEADLHLEDYLEFLAQDKDTAIIATYIEGLREGRRFFRLAREITAKKPVIALKAGGTSGAAKAAVSHTGAITGSEIVYTAAFRQTGIVQVDDEDELCDLALALLNLPLPQGNRIGILTMGGGFGVVTAEDCEKEGLVIAPLGQVTFEKLDTLLPSRWSHGNPVDLVGAAPLADSTTVLSCLHTLVKDKNIDAILSLVSPVRNTDRLGNNLSTEQIEAIQIDNQKKIDMLRKLVEDNKKPLLVVGFMPQQTSRAETPDSTAKYRIPTFPNARRAAKVLRRLAWYKNYLINRMA